jgi:hypothetical protein
LYSGSLRFQCYMASKRQPHFCNLPQTVNGPSKRESLQDRRASSVEKGDVGTLDSLLDTHREHLRLRHLLVGDKSKRSNKVAPLSLWGGKCGCFNHSLVVRPGAFPGSSYQSYVMSLEEFFGTRCQGFPPPLAPSTVVGKCTGSGNAVTKSFIQL